MGELINIYGKHVRVRKALAHADGFFNRVTGLGTARDKASFTRFQRNPELTCEELDALYSDDAMASRVCDVVPDEELRQGYTITVDPRDEDVENGPEEAALVGSDVKDKADEIGLTQKTIEARVWGRAFGAGAILIGTNNGADDPAEPLNLNAIQSVDHLNVLERRYLWPNQFYNNPMEAKVGQPRTYLVTPQASTSLSNALSFQGTIEIHESRLVVFGGARTSIRRRQENNGWDQSILQRMQTTITRFGTSFATLGHLIQDANQAVFKMQGFLDALASDETSLIMKRMEVMDMARSAVRATVLDSEGEEFERQNFQWSGIKEPFEMIMLQLAADARMPVTVLMGQSPAGMNATGESDMRWFYDTIASSRENDVKPALEYILRLIMLSKQGPTGGVEPDSWGVTFPSLWQPTPSESATIELQHAQADNIYHAMGAANADAIALSRFSEGGFERTLTVDLAEHRANVQARSIEGDIDATPIGIVDLESDIAAARSMTAMQAIATEVQSGAITPESAAAIVIASTVGLTFEQALNIVGEPDPVKVAAKAAMAAGLAGAASGDEEGEGDGEAEPDEPEPEDGQETVDAADFVARAVRIVGGALEFRGDLMHTLLGAHTDSKHDPDEDEERRRKRRKRRKGTK